MTLLPWPVHLEVKYCKPGNLSILLVILRVRDTSGQNQNCPSQTGQFFCKSNEKGKKAWLAHESSISKYKESPLLSHWRQVESPGHTEHGGWAKMWEESAMIIYSHCICQTLVGAPKDSVRGPTLFVTFLWTSWAGGWQGLHNPFQAWSRSQWRSRKTLAQSQEEPQVAGCVCQLRLENLSTLLLHRLIQS